MHHWWKSTQAWTIYFPKPPGNVPLPVERSGPTSNTWFLQPTRVSLRTQLAHDQFSHFCTVYLRAQHADTQIMLLRYWQQLLLLLFKITNLTCHNFLKTARTRWQSVKTNLYSSNSDVCYRRIRCAQTRPSVYVYGKQCQAVWLPKYDWKCREVCQTDNELQTEGALKLKAFTNNAKAIKSTHTLVLFNSLICNSWLDQL